MLNNINYAKVYRPRGDNFPSRYCFFDCVATYANFIGRNFELCFISSWRFQYINDPKKDICQNLIISGNSLNNLKEHHGIIIVFHDVEKDKRSLLIDLIGKDSFIIMGVDAYYIPWDLGYNKEHGTHYMILAGIDPISNNLIVIDPYYDKSYVCLGVFDEFIDKIKTIADANCTVSSNTNINKTMIANIRNRFDIVNGKNSFDMIEDFAYNIEYYINQQLQLYNSSLMNLQDDKLKYLLINIYESRQDFSVLLEFYFRSLKTVKNDDILYFKSKILDIINHWNFIQLTYIKAVTSNNLSLTKKIKNSILLLAKAESQLSEELIKFIEHAFYNTSI